MLKVKIDNFEGPFDLLLHLIKKNKMSIYDVKINEITNQYLEFINSMKEMDLELTSEFILMAATLLEIKSRELLPKDKKKEDEEDEQNTQEALIKKLVEYKKFKAAAQFLRGTENTEGISFSKKPEIIEDKTEFNIEEVLKGITLLELFNLYNDLMFVYVSKINIDNDIPDTFFVDKYKVSDKLKYLGVKLKGTKRIDFSELADECECKSEVIVTFLAVLELIKERVIKIHQEGNFEEIYIEGIEFNGVEQLTDDN